MWTLILDAMFRSFITEGALRVVYPDGQARLYGEGDAPVQIRLQTDNLPKNLALRTDLALGEAYMNGALKIVDDDLDGFMALVAVNIARSRGLWWRNAILRGRRFRRVFDQWNPISRARSNVAHHYDLDARLYDLFLDQDRQYSCAYFRHPDMGLEAAQEAKKSHIGKKLLLQPGMKVLEIGCGWGGLSLSLARDYGVEVLGVTLSTEQHRIASARARDLGLSDKVRFELRDYRTVTGQFDRVVSVGMFEHVGAPHYREYFRHIQARLKEKGVALVHTIGRSGPPGTTSPWITKYIFPGGYVPALSEMSAAVEKEGLCSTDIEVWRLHYAETLKHWYDRFMTHQSEALALYDDRFCRMWRYYLKASEYAFRHTGQTVFQYQLARDQTAVPLTRDYLYSEQEGEAWLKAAE